MGKTGIGLINLPLEEATENSLLIVEEQVGGFIEALKKLGIAFSMSKIKPIHGDTEEGRLVPAITITQKPIWVYHIKGGYREGDLGDPDRMFLFYPKGVLELHYYHFDIIPALEEFKAHVERGTSPIEFEVQVVGYTVKGKKYPRINLPPEFSGLIGKKLSITPLKDGSFLIKVKE